MHLFRTLTHNKLVYSTIFILLTILGVLFSYQYLFQTYFAMDEWSFWMEFLRYGPFSMLKYAGVIGSLTGAIRVGLYFTNDVYFHFFGLNILPWHITFLTLHLANIFFLYIVLRKFKISPFSSFLASFYFGIASAGQEVLSWPAAGIPGLGATLFSLIATLLTIYFTETKKMKFLLLAILSSYVSFLFRPTGIVVPALIVALVYLFYKRKNIIPLSRVIIILGAATLILGLCRVFIQYASKMTVLLKAGFDIIFYPLVTLSHIFIPYRLMFRFSDGFINFYYPIIAKDGNRETISHLVVSDFISVVVSLVIIVFIYLLYKNIDKFNKKVLIFGLITFFVQYVPIALNYIDRGGISYLESRHTYPSIVGISIMLSIFFDFMLTKFKSSKSLRKYAYFCLLLLVGVWFFKEMTVTRREVRAQAIDDIAIKKTWESLQTLQLPSSNKMIFYVQSDRSYFYPSWRLPFKLYSSYMMSLAFYGKPFIDRATLGDLQSNNGYINSHNKQFGYFTDINLLTEQVKNGEINISNVVGLHFIDGSYTFVDITPQVRAMIEDKLK